MADRHTHSEITYQAVRKNIEAIAKLEETFDQNRTPGERIADSIGGFTGSLRFVVLHAIVYGLWILINTGIIGFIPKWDPFPFLLLAMVVSLEAIFLSTFVLMKQNRMSRREDLRAHLDLQINLLTEREMTLVLRILERMSGRMGVGLSGEEEAMSEETSVETLADELKEILPEE